MTGRAPIESTTGPNTRPQMPTVPPNAMNHNDITRARS